MKVVDIHPEELIDKLAEGSLTLTERERLCTHLRQCTSCRFEVAVRSDLVCDAPVFEDRPQLTFAGGEPRERVAGTLPDQLLPQTVRSVRSRSRHRWPLAMLAASLVLCAGGAMAAVMTGAVSSRWLHWSPGPKPAVSSARVSAAKPALRLKRAVPAADPKPTPTSEPSANTAPPVASVGAAPIPVAVAEPTPSVISSEATAVARPALIAPRQARQRRAEAAPTRESARAAVTALPAADAGAAEASTAHVHPAAVLFADANRARRDGNVDRAVGLYRALQSRYPSSSESELSRALLAQLLLDRGNPEGALAAFDRYLVEDSPALGAEALVGRARALEQLGKSTQAAAAWRQVQSRFPGSVHARLAATRLAALGMR